MGKSLAAFVTVRYEQGNVAADKAIKRFGIPGFPWLLVLDAGGAEVDEVGGREPAAFIEELARIQAGRDTLPALRAQLQSHPDDVGAAVKLVMRLSNRHPQDAAQLCESTLKQVKPSEKERYAQVLALLAYCHANLRDIERAVPLYDRVLTEFSETDAAKRAALSVGNMMPFIDPDRGLALFKKALQIVEPKDRFGLMNGCALLHGNALRTLTKQLAASAGDSPDLLNFVAWECYERKWLTKEAIVWARRAVALSKRAPNILDTLAHLLFQDGQLEEAIELESEALLGVENPPQRAGFEEALAMFRAVQRVRAERETSK